MAETETWSVYRPEWVRVHVSSVAGQLGRDECVQAFDRNFKGRVLDSEWRLFPEGLAKPRPWKLEVRLPVLKGEWKSPADAERHRQRLGPDAVVVLWGSEEEQRLLDYGREPLSR